MSDGEQENQNKVDKYYLFPEELRPGESKETCLVNETDNGSEVIPQKISLQDLLMPNLFGDREFDDGHKWYYTQ